MAGRRRFLDKNGALLLMMSPGLLLLLVFNYAPMIGLVIAFKNYLAYQGLWGSAWVGLQNFQYLFGTSDAWHITYNTLLMNGLFIITVLVGVYRHCPVTQRDQGYGTMAAQVLPVDAVCPLRALLCVDQLLCVCLAVG